MAVQLAVAAGARVIATASESGHDHLRALGAEPVVYGDGLLHRIRAVAPDGVNAALDAVGSPESIEISAELVSNRDRVVALVASPRAFELGFKVVGAAPGADPGTEIRSKARVELVASVEAGKLQVLVAATYALADTAIAHRALASGHTHGKIVLIP